MTLFEIRYECTICEYKTNSADAADSHEFNWGHFLTEVTG